MNMKALKAFCLVVSRGSLAAAAGEMNLSSPAVSRLITNLEYEIKLTLFSRDKRALVPTPEARIFYREAMRALASLESLPHAASEIKSGTKGRMRVVVMSRLANSLVSSALASFARADPNVALIVELHARRDFERWLASHQFDLGFGPLPLDSSSLATETLFSSPMVVAISRNSPLAKRRLLEPAELVSEPLVAITPDTLLRQQVDAVFLRAGLSPRILMQVSSARMACEIVASGTGYTLCDFFVAHGTDMRKMALIPIAPKFDLEFGVLWPAGEQLSAAGRRLVKFVSYSANQLLDRASRAAHYSGKRKKP